MESDSILTCNIGEKKINCFDGQYGKEQLKQWSQKNILLCPVCGKSYEYCHGKVKTPYFRHKDKSQCEYRYAEAETEEHLNGKRDLYQWLCTQEDVTDVVLEGWLPETHQRPDLMFTYNGEKWVIEYQCTPIATEYFERHELYQAAGIHDIWICGIKKYMGDNMRDKVIEQYCVGYYDAENCRFIFPLNERKYSDLLRLVSNHNKTNGKKMQSWMRCSTYPARFRKYFAVELDGVAFCNGKMVLSKLPLESDISDISMRISKRNKLRGSMSYLPKRYENIVSQLNSVYKQRGVIFSIDTDSMLKDKLCITYECSGSIGILKNFKRSRLPHSYIGIKKLVKDVKTFRDETHIQYDNFLLYLDDFADIHNRSIYVQRPYGGQASMDEMEFAEYIVVGNSLHTSAKARCNLPRFVTHRSGQVIDFAKASDDYIKRVFKNIGFEYITVSERYDGLEEIG